MKIDELGCLVMEHSSPEGNLGDSCAESARYEHLRAFLGHAPQCNLSAFVTSGGYVRHPNSIWRENDFSTDQALPLYMCFRLASPLQAEQMYHRITVEKFYQTGNGDLVSPGFFAELVESKFLRIIFLLGQILMFKFPYRWNDERKWFERTNESSADYLNFIHVALYAPQWVRNFISKELLKEKVRHYYRPEPNAFVVDYYMALIERYF